jgi:hypothetical protein
MIQRIQSVWLLLAAICGFLTTEAAIFKATLQGNGQPYSMMATDSLLLFAVIMGTACLCLIGIFLFKKRPIQFKLSIIGIILSVLALALQVKMVEGYKSTTPTMIKGTYQFGGLLPVLMIIFLILAARAIYKDEKLVKSLDRLR